MKALIYLDIQNLRTFRKIHLPYLKNSVFLIGILIAIEIIKNYQLH